MILLPCCFIAPIQARPETTADGPRFALKVEVEESTPYVGQPIRLVVRSDSAVGPLRTSPPETPDLTFFEVEAEAGETSEFLAVANRPGAVVIPPFEAEVGDRDGRSSAVRLRVKPVPAPIRSGRFLGGVGDLEVEAGLEPPSVRVGGSVTYRITLRGPAALGSTRAPTLEGLDDMEVTALPIEVSADPPMRTFAWSVRAVKAGQWAVPPHRIDYYDPTRSPQRPLTRTTEALRFDSIAPTPFDPSDAVGIGSGSADVESVHRSWQIIAGVSALLIVWAGVAGWRIRRRRRKRISGGESSKSKPDPKSQAARIDREIQAATATEPKDLASKVVVGLIDYLEVACDRPRGALTPGEADEAVVAATGDPELGRHAAALVDLCDLICYSPRNDLMRASGEGETIRLLAVSLFRELGRRNVAPPEKPEGGNASKIPKIG